MYSKNAPHVISLQAGQTVYLCTCGKSANAPYCDGAHQAQGTDKAPLAHTAEKEGSVYVCGCGRTGNNPFCDGAHTK